MKNEKMAAFEELMRDAVNILKGPDDPRIEEITAYMRKYKAKIDMGRNVKHSECAEGDIFASEVVPPVRRQFRRC